MKRCLALILTAATVACSASVSAQAISVTPADNVNITAAASTSSVSITNASGYAEGAFAEWSAVSGASGYNVYADGTQIDSMLIRQYPSCFRADAVGLKAGTHTLKVVPVISGKEDTSKAAEKSVTVTAYDRSGYGWINGTSSGAYNEDGTLKSNAVVVYITEETKDSAEAEMLTGKKTSEGKDETITVTGFQNILTQLKKNTDTRPYCFRLVGNIKTPSTNDKGDIMVDCNSKYTAGITVEGIGNDTTCNGFGIRVKNCTNVEIRNLGFMNCNSDEGDNVGLQQGNDHVWVHNCDMFYGDAGSDADQVKGDGALDCKKSTYVTFSYNHFWDNGKCNLLGLSENTNDGLYITYHHNWYDHSDSRHPRCRYYTVHVYNNYYDGNAKYGIGSTTGSSVLSENNYFRNCKYPYLTSMQGTDYTQMLADGKTAGTLSGEDGGTIKSYGDHIEGAKAVVWYQDDNKEFDAYKASSLLEAVPSSVVSKSSDTLVAAGYKFKTGSGNHTYNNVTEGFIKDGSYKYNVDKTDDVPTVVTANAGRVQGGDFKWTFDNSTADEQYLVDDALKAALVAYKGTVVSIGSGFSDSTTPAETTPAATETKPAETKPAATETKTVATEAPANYAEIIYVSPSGKGSGSSASDPTDVLTAIKNVKAGGCIYLLEGTYKYTDTILIDQNNSGSAGKYKTISAYNGAKVVFDFTGQAVSSSARGFVLDGSYWRFYGFEITQAGDNGMLLSGNNNIIEMMVFNDNEDTGLQLSRYRTDAASIAEWPTNNLIKNCTSKNNCDEATMENADGFAAKLTCGEGNVFDGCISYNNSDDGWDLYAKEATGPIGVVTIKNSIAFRNGFTEDGRGYGDCDGNGFKLGGGGIGTRHQVENCLAFENLNCGFTDNNNPEFGDMKNCTAYNNNLKGAKANYMVYRCNTTATFANMMSYYNTANVTKTNATGIKAGNDKFVGSMTNGVYYNSKYYFAKSETMSNGAKLGDIVTPSDSDFITLKVAGMGTDFHTAWRNADGSPNPGGFAETVSNGTYASLGYHMSNGTTQTDTPSTQPVETTAPADTTKPADTTQATQAPVVTGGVTHNFTTDGTSSSVFNITGNMNSKDVTVTYNGQTFTKALKMESATSITFTATSDGTLTLVTDTANKTIKVNGQKYTTDANGVATVAVSAGAVEITKGDSMNLSYISYNAGAKADTTAATSATTATETTKTTTVETTPSTPSEELAAGDVDGDGEISILDVITINKAIMGKEILTDAQNKAADVDGSGKPDANDALQILKKIVGIIENF